MTRIPFLLAVALVLMLWAGGRSNQTASPPLASTTLELGKIVRSSDTPPGVEGRQPLPLDMEKVRGAGYRWVCLFLPPEFQKKWDSPQEKDALRFLESFEAEARGAKAAGLLVVAEVELPSVVITGGGRQASLWSAFLEDTSRRLRGKVDVWKLSLPAGVSPSGESVRLSADAIRSANPSTAVLLATHAQDVAHARPLHLNITKHLDAVGLTFNRSSFNARLLGSAIQAIRAEDSFIPVWVFLPGGQAEDSSGTARLASILAFNGVSAAFMEIPENIPAGRQVGGSLFRLLSNEPSYQGMARSPQGEHLHIFRSGSKTVVVTWTENNPRTAQFTSPGKVVVEDPDGHQREFSGGQTATFTLGPDPVIIAGPGGWNPEGIR